MSDKKKKKPKTVYIDDGRTIADMSVLNDGPKSKFVSSRPHVRGGKGTFKEQMQTYFAAVKMMFLPMLVMMAGICVIFLILYLVFSLA
ncbi:MAG: hypothetical protein IJX92_07655 [Clostridia bacterium]|nr:hypothetical protein [Clostridia bacterium]